MPWKVQTPMSGRRQFVDEYVRRTVSMTALCACYGISRRVGYKWVARFLVEGDRHLLDHSRRPLTSPWSVAPELAALLLEARHRHPTWGPRKILDYLTPRHPRTVWPAASTLVGPPIVYRQRKGILRNVGWLNRQCSSRLRRGCCAQCRNCRTVGADLFNHPNGRRQSGSSDVEAAHTQLLPGDAAKAGN